MKLTIRRPHFFLLSYILFILSMALFLWTQFIPWVDPRYYSPPENIVIEYGWPCTAYRYSQEMIPYHRGPVFHNDENWELLGICVDGGAGLIAASVVAGLCELMLRRRMKRETMDLPPEVPKDDQT